ncbi:MAG: PCRF domain-containing protein, partial [Candidatus Atribacteria bacterium]|nr:PCRF domain-containing protein [Candidatus Atribacteria bacterium]
MWKNKAEEITRRYTDLSTLLSDPAVTQDLQRYQKLARSLSEIEDIVRRFQEYQACQKNIEEDHSLLKMENDSELRDLLEEETVRFGQRLTSLEEEIKFLLIPRDPNDNRNTLMEIRAGTGGEEAALFVSDLFRMYSRYAETQSWKVEIMSSSPTELGGMKEIIFAIEGKNAYSKFKYESGVHRVQRVPITEAGGRIHTSTATVAVLPEADEVEVNIRSEDIRVDVYRSTGHGGQSVNTTDSAVRLTHLATGLVVTC